MGKRVISLGLCAILIAPAAVEAAAGAVPVIRTRHETKTPDFEKAPVRDDFGSLLIHLGDTIMDKKMPEERVPGVDLFLTNLEDGLRGANDRPLGLILRNASGARENLRLAFNDLSAAGSKPNLKDAQKRLQRVAAELPALIGKLEENALEIQAVSHAANAQVAGMVQRRPASTGAKTPVWRLEAIVPLEPEIRKLLKRLRHVGKRVAKAKGLIANAKKHSRVIKAYAGRAGDLDHEAIERLRQRRTRGIPADYKIKMNSKKIIGNANGFVTRAVEGGESVIDEMEKQLDPKHEKGVRWTIDRLIQADRLIQLAKEEARQKAMRINFNHEVRLNKYIQMGWDVSHGTRREAWWLGRASMAISSSYEDARLLEAAARRADAAVRRVKGAVEETGRSVASLKRTLGRFRDRPYRMPKRKLDAPPLPKQARGRDRRNHPDVKSKRLKVPKTFNVGMDEITGSFDGTWQE